MNKVSLMGRLAADPELRQTPAGVAVAKFRIAVNRRFAKEGQQQADFISCEAWRNTAEFICKYFRKGTMIAVSGSIQTRTWDGQDGKKQYSTEVVIDEAYFTGSRAETAAQNNSMSADGYRNAPPDGFGQAGFIQETDYGDNSDLSF